MNINHHINSARLTASLTFQLHFQCSPLALGRPICMQVHCTQYDPLVLDGELYLWFLSLLFPLSQKLHKKKISSSDFCGILCICRKTCQKSPYNLISVFLAFSKSLLLDYHNILFQIHVQNKENFHAVNAGSFIKGCCLCRKKPSTSILSNYKSRWYH